MNVTQAVGIVGLGTVSGYGWGVDSLWNGLLSGKSAAQPVVFEEFAGLAAMVPDGGNEEDSVTLFGRALYGSGREAVADATARGWHPGARVGLILCTSLGEVQGWRDLYFKHGGHVRRRHYLQLLPSTAPSMFMAEYGFNGPSMNVGAACASGALGVILARQWLVSGFATDVIVSGTDLSVTAENAWGMGALGVLATEGTPEQACRPFQEGSQGFLAGEASAALVVTGQADAEVVRPRARGRVHPRRLPPHRHQARRAAGGRGVVAGDGRRRGRTRRHRLRQRPRQRHPPQRHRGGRRGRRAVPANARGCTRPRCSPATVWARAEPWRPPSPR